MESLEGFAYTHMDDKNVEDMDIHHISDIFCDFVFYALMEKGIEGIHYEVVDAVATAIHRAKALIPILAGKWAFKPATPEEIEELIFETKKDVLSSLARQGSSGVKNAILTLFMTVNNRLKVKEE